MYAGHQGDAFRRGQDAADHTPFCVALASSFDKAAQRKEAGNRVVLATQSDGTLMKPTVTLEQLAAVAFKVISCIQLHLWTQLNLQ